SRSAARLGRAARTALRARGKPRVRKAVLPMNYFLENPDLVTTFDQLVPWEKIVPLVCGPDADVKDTVATWRELLGVAGEYIGTEIAGRAKQVDELGIIRDGGRVETGEP